MTKLTKEANRAKYQYNKKYVDAYWERKAKAAKIEVANEAFMVTVTIPDVSDKKAVKDYIKNLEVENHDLRIKVDDLSKKLEQIKLALSL